MLLEQCQVQCAEHYLTIHLHKLIGHYLIVFIHQLFRILIKNINYIVDSIPDEVLDACTDFDAFSLKYFIAKIKEGVSK